MKFKKDDLLVFSKDPTKLYIVQRMLHNDQRFYITTANFKDTAEDQSEWFDTNTGVGDYGNRVVLATPEQRTRLLIGADIEFES